MAKVRFNKLSITRLQARIKRSLEAGVNKMELSRKIGEFVVDRIQRVTRSGKSIVTGKRFERLSPNTLKTRRYLERFNTTHAAYRGSSRVANLTFTGQLLDSLQWRRIGRGRITVSPGGVREPYKTGPSGKTSTKVPSNLRLARWLSQGYAPNNLPPRPFIGMDAVGVQRIERIAIKELRKQLRKNNLQ